jgi:uncharacterized protein
MVFQWTKVPLLALVCGLCLSGLGNANAQSVVETFSVTVPDAVVARPLTLSPEEVPLQAPADPSEPALPRWPQALPQVPAQAGLARVESGPTVRVALLLPLRSSTLGQAAGALRAGFYAAYEREHQGIEVTLFETGDTPQDVLAGYRNASAQHDIVVGPMSRTGVAALVRSGEVMRPTLALTAPDAQEEGELRMPAQMLVLGLAIEDEARQVADWARRDHAAGTAYVVHTRTAWQRRAARAFAERWSRNGVGVKPVELDVNDGFLSGVSLQRLREHLDADPSGFLFAALDAGQTRQLRESVGREVPLYGTSQLNPLALEDHASADPVEVMDGVNLLDIPWQLQPDHPAVMVYPRLALESDHRRSADLERLYALGIDAYRVAREIAAQHTSFELDGVTGRLVVRFGRFGPFFERTTQQAVYRRGSVSPAGMPN